MPVCVVFIDCNIAIIMFANWQLHTCSYKRIFKKKLFRFHELWYVYFGTLYIQMYLVCKWLYSPTNRGFMKHLMNTQVCIVVSVDNHP